MWEVIAVAAVVATVTALFSYFYEPRQALLAFGALFFGSALALGLAVFKNRRALWSMPARRALILLVVVAALLRMAALVAPVSLSDDVWRYLWDGDLLIAGENPYASRPVDIIEAGQGDGQLFAAMNSPEHYTVYPPLSQSIFAAALGLEALTGGAAERWLRAIFALFDLAAVGLLGLVLIRLGRPVIWAALYGWHPLAYWEVAGGGHTEALGMVFLVLLVAALISRRFLLAGVALGLAGLAKWTFLAVSPVVGFYLLRRHRWAAAITTAFVAVLVVAVGYWPLYFDDLIPNHGESIRLYSEVFSFNAPIFYSLRFFLGYEEGITDSVAHITGPLLTWTTVLAIGAAALWQNGSTKRLFAGMTLAAGAYVIFSPVFHPWYALPFLLAGVLAGWTTPAVLCLVVVVSYAFYAPWSTPRVEIFLMGLQSAIVVFWASREWGPDLIAAILERRGRQKAEWVDEFLHEPAKILDLGASEGFVGLELERRGHRVSLADVVDRNRTQLPMTVYDGRILPFDDQIFDVVVLSYVLHHAGDPDQVLREAFRVGRKVIVLETVYEREWDRRLVTFLDHMANMLRGMAPEPLAFDRVQGWVARVEKLGRRVVSWRWLGRGIHRHVVMEIEK